jgi:iron complex outermembrane recepter protein
MKHFILSISAIFCCGAIFAQTTSQITGNIKDGGQQKVIDAASISLLQAKDSSLVKTAIADATGNFLFDQVKPGTYLVMASSAGYGKTYSTALQVSANLPIVNAGTLQLVPAASTNLKEVIVANKKPLIERKPDRTVINVEAAVSNAGTTALEVLEKSPGITVDKDGNISLKGRQGVMVMLDGKPSYLTGQELTNLLNNMPSANLDQIEIYTNPPARFDAAGNAGVINIKTKKNKQKGFNGSVNLAYGQGILPKTNNSANVNYRTGKVNLFASISANYRRNWQEIDITRRYKNDDNSLNAVFEQTATERRYNHNYNSKIGIDYYLSKKTTVGAVLTGFTTPGTQIGYNASYLKNPQGVVDSIVTAESLEKSSWKNGNININFRHQFDSTGRELTGDFDYSAYRTNRNQNFINTSYTDVWDKRYADNLTGELPSNINIYTAKLDYTQRINGGIKMDAGIKTGFVNTDNTADYNFIVNGDKIPDYEKTNRFSYKENINAGYVNFSKEFKKWSFQAGLRAENTNISGYQYGNVIKPDSAFEQHYTNVFPTLFASYSPSEKNMFSLSYGRRITRPDYEDLNPFLFFLDKFTYGGGNPFLQPAYAQSVEFSHTYNQFLTTTINYAHTKNLFADVFEQLGYATIVKKGNFGQTKTASISVSAQIPVKKWWMLIAYNEYNYSHYKGLLNGENVNLKAGNYVVNINNQFTLKKGWSAELSGFYRSPGIEGQIRIFGLGQMNVGVAKQILKNKGTLKLNIRDILYTMPANGSINFQRTEATFAQRRDSRVATVSFVYRFGKPIKGSQKRKTGGAGSEQQRVKSSN